MKKQNQLGMNPGTAAGRLTRDLLFAAVIREGHKCFHCGGELERHNFSVEHKTPWLDSDDPVGLYFDLDNIGYSHLSCNAAAARKPHKYHPSALACKSASARRTWSQLTREQQQERRREKYRKYGC